MKKIKIGAGCLFLLLFLSPELKGQPLMNSYEQSEGQGGYMPQQYSSQPYQYQPYQSSGSTVNVNSYEGGGLQGGYNRGFVGAEGMRYGEGRGFGGAEGMRYGERRGGEMHEGNFRGGEGMREGDRGFENMDRRQGGERRR